jgi:hypothetical protein
VDDGHDGNVLETLARRLLYRGGFYFTF